jgi:hypothetical protein
MIPVAWVPVSVGLTVSGLAGVVWYFRRERSFDHVEGTVVDHAVFEPTDGVPRIAIGGVNARGPFYESVIAFTYRDRAHRITRGPPASPAELDVGSTIRLRIPPGHPERADTVRGWGLLAALGLIILGVTGIALGS